MVNYGATFGGAASLDRSLVCVFLL